MNDSERRAVEQVRVLWPHLSPTERMQWAKQLRGLFDSLTQTIGVLSSEIEIPEAAA